MFSNQANFSALLKGGESIKVSKVLHKAVIEVNEVGTEAAAATGIYIHSFLIKLPPFINFHC